MDQDYDEYSGYGDDLDRQYSYDLSMQRQPSYTQLKCLTIPEIMEQLEHIIEDLQGLAALDFDNMMEVFELYRWDQDKFKTKFFNEQDTLRSQGIIRDHTFQTLPSQLCQVCICTQPLIQLPCKHSFCQDCLQNNIQSKVFVDSNPTVKCMQDKCTYRLPYSFILKISNPETVEAYQNALCRRFVDESQYLAWCPGINCKYIIEAYETSSKEVHCKCGILFCFRCKDELHPPAPCDIAQKWVKEIKKDEANIKWISINTKICPFCKRAVERSEGCNYMMCKPPGGCGRAFCYVCSNPWEPDHKDHFKCTKYREDPKKDSIMEREKEFLKRYNFYYERFLNSEGCRRKAEQRLKEIPNYQLKVQEIYQFTLNQSQFLHEAEVELVESRVVIKWSYVLGYFLSSTDKNASLLFDNYQEEFEVACDQLAQHLVLLFNEIETLENPHMRQTRDMFQQCRDFEKRKSDIQNSLVKCKKYKDNLVEAVNTGSIYTS